QSCHCLLIFVKESLGKISFTTDLWSDPDLAPFMAVTAHWIQALMVETSAGPKHVLKLRADLIGFHCVPGRHTGQHLSQAFLFLLDRLKITYKVRLMLDNHIEFEQIYVQIGWITMDNASNNDTFIAALEQELTRRQIAFDAIKRRIR
ncbi:uncharacterized protein LAESUDRAFT_657303, partial [Laetiporus sulphureus 93-53]